MKKYRFHLEAVRQQRKLIHEQKAREFALAMGQLELERERLSTIHRRQSETIDGFREKKQRGLTVRDSVLYLSYLDRLVSEEKAQVAMVEGAENRVEIARDALENARVQYEIMEKMKEKSREAYTDLFRHEEQRFIDEVGTRRYKSLSITNDE